MEGLFRTLPKLLKQFEETSEVRDAVVFAAWKKTSGKSLSRHTAPLELTEKTLVIAVSDSIWKSHLESLAGQMIFKINSIFKQVIVTFIEFRIDEQAVLANRKGIQETELSDEELKKIALEEVSSELRRSSDSIEDDSLRSQFLLAAGSCLARKKRMRKL